MRNTLFAVLMSVTMIAATPTGARADNDHVRRYYDRDRRDYHTWNDNEARAYRHWRVEEQHREYREFARAPRHDQRDYWRWRHEHADWR